jgi:hypothetical protein
MLIMDSKLTLKLDKIEKVVVQYDNDFEISPFIKSLKTGIKLPVDYDENKVCSDYLEEKYK